MGSVNYVFGKTSALLTETGRKKVEKLQHASQLNGVPLVSTKKLAIPSLLYTEDSKKHFLPYKHSNVAFFANTSPRRNF